MWIQYWTEEAALEAIKPFAVKPVNIMVSRVQLQNLHQERDEPVRSFCARLRGQAGVCNFTKTKICPCHREVVLDYSEDIVRDALIRGLVDEDIKLDILGQCNQQMTLDETLKLSEAKEAGKRSAHSLISPDNSASSNATSSYKQRERFKQKDKV